MEDSQKFKERKNLAVFFVFYFFFFIAPWNLPRFHPLLIFLPLLEFTLLLGLKDNNRRPCLKIEEEEGRMKIGWQMESSEKEGEVPFVIKEYSHAD